MCADKADEIEHKLAAEKAEKESKEKAMFQTFASKCLGKVELRYQSTFDENGLVYLLGTLGKQCFFENPAKKWMMNVSASSISPESDKPSEIASRRDCTVSTNEEDHPMITIEFTQASIIPTKYSIKSSSKKGNGTLRTWNLLASKDGNSWDKLSSHKKDNSLNESNSMATWDLSTKHAYKFFRIRMEGSNSNNQKVLNIGGIEFYGFATFHSA
jgi:E3 ubiquitin-protein ligase HECTD1